MVSRINFGSPCGAMMYRFSGVWTTCDICARLGQFSHIHIYIYIHVFVGTATGNHTVQNTTQGGWWPSSTLPCYLTHPPDPSIVLREEATSNFAHTWTNTWQANGISMNTHLNLLGKLQVSPERVCVHVVDYMQENDLYFFVGVNNFIRGNVPRWREGHPTN